MSKLMKVLIFFFVALVVASCGSSSSAVPTDLSSVAPHLKVFSKDSGVIGDSTIYAVDQTFDDCLRTLQPALTKAGYKTVGIQTRGISRLIEFSGVGRNVFTLADNPNGMATGGDVFQNTNLPPVSIVYMVLNDKS